MHNRATLCFNEDGRRLECFFFFVRQDGVSLKSVGFILFSFCAHEEQLREDRLKTLYAGAWHDGPATCQKWNLLDQAALRG